MTAYEMRISDWSSDVCSSDLLPAGLQRDRLAVLDQRDDVVAFRNRRPAVTLQFDQQPLDAGLAVIGQRAEIRRAVGKFLVFRADPPEIGRASCRERVCQYV